MFNCKYARSKIQNKKHIKYTKDKILKKKIVFIPSS